MESIEFTCEWPRWGGHYKPLPGALWRVLFFDRADGQFYAGSADCPWEALAWALVEREERRALGNYPTMARKPHATPTSTLAMVKRMERVLTPRTIATAPSDGEPGCTGVTQIRKNKSAAARRSKTKKGPANG